MPVLQQVISEQESKQDRIDRVKANLPLPDDPAGPPPESSSMDSRTVNVGSGGVNVKLGTAGEEGLREPATQESSVRQAGGGFKSGVPPRNENTDMKQVKNPGNYRDPNE